MKFKLSPIQKTTLIIVGLVFITWFVSFITEKVFEYRKLKKEKEENARKLREGFGLDDIGDFFKKIPAFFEWVGNFFTEVEDFFASLGTGFPNMGKGIKNHAEVGAREIGDGFRNGAINLAIILDCAFDKFGKAFYGCTLYYIIDLIYGIIYGLCIELPHVLVKAITGVDLGFVGDIITPIISFLDDMAYSLSGFHIDRWPDSVQSKCYKCKSFYDGSEATFTQRGQDFYNTNKQLAKGFTSLFGVIPNPAWGDWWKGNHLDGNDQTNIFS